MRVLVTGGTGRLGRELVTKLREQAHEVLVASRTPAGEGRVQLDLATGEGLDEALRGVEAVVHAASSPFRGTRRVDIEGTGRLLAASHRADVAHVAYVSIVGIERVPTAYYRAKLETESVIERGPVPWSILRATQFHPFVDEMLAPLAWSPVVPLPRDVRIQPVDVPIVADALAAAVASGAGGRLEDLGGPEVLTLGEVLGAWLAARRAWRGRLFLPLPGAMIRELRAGGLCCPDRPGAGRTWSAWLTERYLRDGSV